tara:strand:+ start:333 stop:494 length:162 start_codon:yes stop_codon:yes gene_type:complete
MSIKGLRPALKAIIKIKDKITKAVEIFLTIITLFLNLIGIRLWLKEKLKDRKR